MCICGKIVENVVRTTTDFEPEDILGSNNKLPQQWVLWMTERGHENFLT